jgi:hypothetical protein
MVEIEKSREEKNVNKTKEVSACTTSVTSSPAFYNLRVKNTKDLVPPMQLSNEEDKCNVRKDEKRKTDQAKEAEDVGVHDLYEAEWNAFLEHELNRDDGMLVSSLTFSDWSEAGVDSETMEFYDVTTPGFFVPATKV